MHLRSAAFRMPDRAGKAIQPPLVAMGKLVEETDPDPDGPGDQRRFDVVPQPSGPS